jgi:hypothetical protein
MWFLSNLKTDIFHRNSARVGSTLRLNFTITLLVPFTNYGIQVNSYVFSCDYVFIFLLKRIVMNLIPRWKYAQFIIVYVVFRVTSSHYQQVFMTVL